MYHFDSYYTLRLMQWNCWEFLFCVAFSNFNWCLYPASKIADWKSSFSSLIKCPFEEMSQSLLLTLLGMFSRTFMGWFDLLCTYLNLLLSLWYEVQYWDPKSQLRMPLFSHWFHRKYRGPHFPNFGHLLSIDGYIQPQKSQIESHLFPLQNNGRNFFVITCNFIGQQYPSNDFLFYWKIW